MADVAYSIAWDALGEKIYELGVDRGVFYKFNSSPTSGQHTYGNAEAWNGLTAVNESADGGEANAIWADNINYANIMSAEKFTATIEAYTYPNGFAECDGSAELATGVYVTQQPRKTFGFSYRTKIGNDTDGMSHGYKLHLVYGALAAPSDKNRETVNDSPDGTAFSWSVSTTPVSVTGKQPTAHIIIDSTKIAAEKLALVEAALYGTTGSSATEAYLPLPDELTTLLA